MSSSNSAGSSASQEGSSESANSSVEGVFTCDDSDGGDVPDTSGTVTVYLGDEELLRAGDECTGPYTLKELFCKQQPNDSPYGGYALGIIEHGCAQGCEAGQCKPPPLDYCPPGGGDTSTACLVCEGQPCDAEATLQCYSGTLKCLDGLYRFESTSSSGSSVSIDPPILKGR